MSFVLACATAVIFLVLDQITKYIVTTNMTLGETVDFIDGFLDFTYIHNDGGAWGMLGGERWLLLGVTSVVMVIIVIFLIKNAQKSLLLFWAGCLVISGGLGNMIDRIFRGGEVIDFLRVRFIDFPIFNIADCAVVIGAGLLILYFVIDTANDIKAKRQKNDGRD